MFKKLVGVVFMVIFILCAIGGLVYYGMIQMAIEDYNCGYENLYKEARDGQQLSFFQGKLIGEAYKSDYRLYVINTQKDTLSICHFVSQEGHAKKIIIDK